MGQSTFSVIQILCICCFIFCTHLSISETRPKCSDSSPAFLVKLFSGKVYLSIFSARLVYCFSPSVYVTPDLLSSCLFKIIFFPEKADYCLVCEEVVRTSTDKGCWYSTAVNKGKIHSSVTSIRKKKTEPCVFKKETAFVLFKMAVE